MICWSFIKNENYLNELSQKTNKRAWQKSFIVGFNWSIFARKACF